MITEAMSRRKRFSTQKRPSRIRLIDVFAAGFRGTSSHDFIASVTTLLPQSRLYCLSTPFRLVACRMANNPLIC